MFIEELLGMLKAAKTPMPKMIGAGFDMPNFDAKKIEREIKESLASV